MRIGRRKLGGGLRRTWIGSRRRSRRNARRTGALVLGWLIIGAVAAGQRHYYSGSAETCAKAGTIAGTILAGPLNYLGANPKISCRIPRPSK
jgi:hypothetical protein